LTLRRFASAFSCVRVSMQYAESVTSPAAKDKDAPAEDDLVLGRTLKMENATIYRCTDNGSDATAHEEDGFFVVRAGSRFGVVRNGNDGIVREFRRAIARDFSFDEKSLTLNEGVKLLYADEAARIVTGCVCDEHSWIAPDGSHPIVRKDACM